jgi:hypothetical protein
MSLELIKAARKLGLKIEKDWLETLTLEQVTTLQTWKFDPNRRLCSTRQQDLTKLFLGGFKSEVQHP